MCNIWQSPQRWDREKRKIDNCLLFCFWFKNPSSPSSDTPHVFPPCWYFSPIFVLPVGATDAGEGGTVFEAFKDGEIAAALNEILGPSKEGLSVF